MEGSINVGPARSMNVKSIGVAPSQAQQREGTNGNQGNIIGVLLLYTHPLSAEVWNFYLENILIDQTKKKIGFGMF